LLPRQHWAATLYGYLNINLAITGGVQSTERRAQRIIAGANITMMASAPHIHGMEHIGRVPSDVQH
jgi:dihydroorotate dehydrogenase (fumarate)